MWRFRKRSRRNAHMKTRNGGFIVKRITVILKSGKEFSFDALEVEAIYDANNPRIRIDETLRRIDWVGASGKIPLYINPTEVAAIYYDKLNENNGGDTVT